MENQSQTSHKQSRVPLIIMVVILQTVILFPSATSQDLKFNTYLEVTSVNLKNGYLCSYEWESHLEVGAFYQQQADFLMSEEDLNNLPRFYEEEFYGLRFSYPLAVMLEDKFQVKLNARTGVTNGENFLITPSMSSSLKFFNVCSIGAGVGVRSFRPTFMGSFGIRI